MFVTIYHNKVWREFQTCDEDSLIDYHSYCLQDQLESIKLLSRQVLEEIFEVAKGDEFLTDFYLDSIIERRDKVLEYCMQQKHNE